MRKLVFLSVATNAFASLGPQVFAMVSLDPLSFGIFSSTYLSFALGLAITTSVVSDPWILVNKTAADGGKGRSAALYSSLLVLVIGVLFLVTYGLNWVVTRDATVAIMGALAGGFSVYRASARFLRVYQRRFGAAILSDTASVASIGIVASIGSVLGSSPLIIALAAWLAAGAAGLLALPPPRFEVAQASKWIRKERNTIRPLVRDSLLVELSAVGTPYALLPVMGFQTFGLYRGLSNTSAPARLAVAPIRPLLVEAPERMTKKRFVTAICGVALLMGLSAWFALLLVRATHMDLGTLAELAGYAEIAGLFVAGSVLVTIYSVVVRALRNPKILLLGRLIHIFVTTAFPIVGYIWKAGSGALWGVALGTAIAGLSWLCCSLWAVCKQDS